MLTAAPGATSRGRRQIDGEKINEIVKLRCPFEYKKCHVLVYGFLYLNRIQSNRSCHHKCSYSPHGVGAPSLLLVLWALQPLALPFRPYLRPYPRGRGVIFLSFPPFFLFLPLFLFPFFFSFFFSFFPSFFFSFLFWRPLVTRGARGS